MFLSKSQESIADGFIEKLVSWAKNIKVSEPLEEGCRLVPDASKGQVLAMNLTFFMQKFTFLKVDDAH